MKPGRLQSTNDLICGDILKKKTTFILKVINSAGIQDYALYPKLLFLLNFITGNDKKSLRRN